MTFISSLSHSLSLLQVMILLDSGSSQEGSQTELSSNETFSILKPDISEKEKQLSRRLQDSLSSKISQAMASKGEEEEEEEEKEEEGEKSQSVSPVSTVSSSGVVQGEYVVNPEQQVNDVQEEEEEEEEEEVEEEVEENDEDFGKFYTLIHVHVHVCVHMCLVYSSAFLYTLVHSCILLYTCTCMFFYSILHVFCMYFLNGILLVYYVLLFFFYFS